MTTHLAAFFSGMGDWSTIVHRVGWLLLHSLWQFCLVALLLAAVLRAMNRASSTKRYAATLAALGLMIFCTGMTWFACNRGPDVALAKSASIDDARQADAVSNPWLHLSLRKERSRERN